jgi:hypothetical protein
MKARLQAAVSIAGRRPGATITLVGAAMLATYVTAIVIFPKPDGRVVFGDASHHFVQLRSLVFDRDVDLLNEHVRLYGLEGTKADTDRILRDLGTPTGRVRNYMPIGPALLWAPLYVVVVGIQWFLAAVGLGESPDGFGRAAQIAPGATGVVAATLSAWLSWRTAARFTSRTSAILAVLGVWLGSHALYYSLVSPSYSHAASMLTSSLFCHHWLAMGPASPSIVRAARLGALAGAAALMRWQDAIWVVVPLLEVAGWQTPWTKRATGLALVAGAALAVFSPQMFVWNVLYGQPLAVPQGASFMRWGSPELVAVLASDRHGLFIWAPLLILALPGLVRFARVRPGISLPLAIVLLGSWYINAAVADWWAGEAFGARRFLSLFPLFALGLATWFHRAEANATAFAWRTVAVICLTVANVLLLLQYQLAMKGLETIAPYPDGWFDMWVVRFVVPVRLVTWWAS